MTMLAHLVNTEFGIMICIEDIIQKIIHIITQYLFVLCY